MKQLLRQPQPPRLRQLYRGDAQLSLHRAAQVAGAHAEALGELIEPVLIQISGVDSIGRLPHQAGNRIDRRKPWSQLGPTAEAGPKAGALGLAGTREERAPGPRRSSRRTKGAAVDACGLHSHEEDAVEPLVAGGQGSVAASGVQWHAPRSTLAPERCLAVFGPGSQVTPRGEGQAGTSAAPGRSPSCGSLPKSASAVAPRRRRGEFRRPAPAESPTR